MLNASFFADVVFDFFFAIVVSDFFVPAVAVAALLFGVFFDRAMLLMMMNVVSDNSNGNDINPTNSLTATS